MAITKNKQWFHLLLAVAFLLATLLRPAPVFACSCAYDPNLTEAEQLLENVARDFNKIVFVGTVQKSNLVLTDLVLRSSADPVYVTFTVERVYKGNVGQEFTLSTAMDDTSCGYTFNEGTRYLVFVGDMFGDDSWNSGLCSGNVQEPTAVFLQTLGDGYAPTAIGDSGTFPRTYTVMLAVGTMVLAAGGWRLWSKKRPPTNN